MNITPYRFSIVRLHSRRMSSADVFSNLFYPLRELLVGSVRQDQRQLGVSEKDKADITQWIEKAAQPDFVKPDALPVRHNSRTFRPSFITTVQSLDAYLVPRTYLVSNYLTAADIAVYGALRPTFVRVLHDAQQAFG